MDDEDRKIDSLVIGLIGFPKGGTLGLDGSSIVLKTEDFVGVKDVPRNSFHLVTCKNGHGTSLGDRRNNTNTIDTAVTVGFLLFGDDNGDGGSGHLIRKYDPQTEEVASKERSPVDEISQRNLVQQMTDGSIPPSRVLRYDQIVGSESSSINQAETLLSQRKVWREQTRYICRDSSSSSTIFLLKDIRGLSSGDKIVPGCYHPENESTKYGDPDATTATAAEEIDGTSLAYPPIPVVDPKLSLAKHKHHGTNRFLSRLEPQERTKLFLSSTSDHASKKPNFVWLNRVLEDCYGGSWEALLGDLQLSYVLFLYLGCYSSLEHWKDLLAMLSLAVDGTGGTGGRERPQHKHESLYRGLLRLLPYQLSSMNDPEFLEDIDEGGGNFLVPSLARLKKYYETERQTESDAMMQDQEEEEEEELLSKFRHVLSAKFPRSFSFRQSLPTITRIRSGSDGSDRDNGDADDTPNEAMDTEIANWNYVWDADEDDDDEDGPVVVSSEEIEASMVRLSASASPGAASTTDAAAANQLRKDYPLLAAAVMPSEDVLMTCARALDEKTDVSLVREAAAYLEEVEQRRGYF